MEQRCPGCGRGPGVCPTNGRCPAECEVAAEFAREQALHARAAEIGPTLGGESTIDVLRAHMESAAGAQEEVDRDLERLDGLERRALRSYYDTYGPPTSDAERLFVQRGIDAMRFAVATEEQAPASTEDQGDAAQDQERHRD